MYKTAHSCSQHSEITLLKPNENINKMFLEHFLLAGKDDMAFDLGCLDMFEFPYAVVY